MILREEALHFIWKYQLFDTTRLVTTKGESIVILQLGQHNSNQGPDFLMAKIQIGEQILLGHVELHIENKDWYTHGHQHDNRYSNTILHVVYEPTDEIYTLTEKNTQIPILCLRPFISNHTLTNIAHLISAKHDIPCQTIFKLPQAISIEAFKTRLFSERLTRKSEWIRKLLKTNNNDWESTFYQAMLYGFGIPVNADIFLSIAQSLPQKILARQIDSLDKLEALLLGQAHLIEGDDSYARHLKSEYEFLKHQFKLQPIHLQPLKSKLLPSSFPTIRLIQFASFIHSRYGLFAKLTTFQSINEIKPYFQIKVSQYWETHYDFGKKYDKSKNNSISNAFFEKILINVILPFRFLINHDHPDNLESIAHIYSQLKHEENNKTKKMQNTFQLKNKSALDSQAYNEWYSFYCLQKKCFDCPIGYMSLKS